MVYKDKANSVLKCSSMILIMRNQFYTNCNSSAMCRMMAGTLAK